MGLLGFNPGYFLLRLTTTTFAVASSSFSMPTFLTKWLPDLGWHPCGRALWLLYLFSLSSEDMHPFGSLFAKPDVRVTTIGCFQSGLPWLLSCEDSDLVAIFVPKGKVPHLFLGQ